MTIRERPDRRRSPGGGPRDPGRVASARAAGWRRVDELDRGRHPGSPYFALGTVDQIVEQIEAARERWGFSYIQVEGRDIDAFAPIMER